MVLILKTAAYKALTESPWSRRVPKLQTQPCQGEACSQHYPAMKGGGLCTMWVVTACRAVQRAAVPAAWGSRVRILLPLALASLSSRAVGCLGTRIGAKGTLVCQRTPTTSALVSTMDNAVESETAVHVHDSTTTKFRPRTARLIRYLNWLKFNQAKHKAVKP